MASLTPVKGREMRERRIPQLAIRIGVPIAVVLIWFLVSLDTDNFYFPPLVDMLDAFVDNWLSTDALSDILPSLIRVLGGFIIAVLLGTILGLLLGLAPKVRQAVNPAIEFIRAVPAPALIPPAILLLGFGDEMKISIIALVCLFPILLNVVDGVIGLDPLMEETAQVYRIPGKRYIRRVLIPAVTPQVFAGMRTSLPLALVMMVVTEMIGGTNGIGHFVLIAERSFEITDMWSGILLIGLLGFLLNVGFVSIERRVLRWHRGARGSASS